MFKLGVAVHVAAMQYKHCRPLPRTSALNRATTRLNNCLRVHNNTNLLLRSAVWQSAHLAIATTRCWPRALLAASLGIASGRLVNVYVLFRRALLAA